MQLYHWHNVPARITECVPHSYQIRHCSTRCSTVWRLGRTQLGQHRLVHEFQCSVRFPEASTYSNIQQVFHKYLFSPVDSLLTAWCCLHDQIREPWRNIDDPWMFVHGSLFRSVYVSHWHGTCHINHTVICYSVLYLIIPFLIITILFNNFM